MSAVRSPDHYHFVTLPSGRSIRTTGAKRNGNIKHKSKVKKKRNPPVEGLLGTLGAIAGGAIGSLIAPGAGTALGAALGGAAGSAADSGGKKKKPSAAASAGATTQAQSVPSSNAIPASDPTLATVLHLAENALSKDDIKSLLMTVPPPVLDQIRAAIKGEQADQALAAVNIDRIASKTAPALNKIYQALHKTALQQQATYEHNQLNKAAAVVATNTKNQNTLAKGQLKVLARLDKLEKNLLARQSHNRNVNAAFGVPLVYAG